MYFLKRLMLLDQNDSQSIVRHAFAEQKRLNLPWYGGSSSNCWWLYDSFKVVGGPKINKTHTFLNVQKVLIWVVFFSNLNFTDFKMGKSVQFVISLWNFFSVLSLLLVVKINIFWGLMAACHCLNILSSDVGYWYCKYELETCTIHWCILYKLDSKVHKGWHDRCVQLLGNILSCNWFSLCFVHESRSADFVVRLLTVHQCHLGRLGVGYVPTVKQIARTIPI